MDTKWLKRRALRFFFVAEIVLFVSFYLFGSNGIQCLFELQYQQQKLDQQTRSLQQEVIHLHEQLAHWEAAPFFKEKIAREQLQMAREGDEIYYLN